MATTSRYSKTETYNFRQYYGTPEAVLRIRTAIKNNLIAVKEVYIKGSQRLDHISFQEYGKEEYWWVIAAASGISWGCQVPSDTLLLVPTSINQVLTLL